MRKLFTFLVIALLAMLSAFADGPTYTSGITVSNATGAVSTAYYHNGVQSYMVTGGGSNNPDINITVNTITNWTTIVKATVWVYSTSTWNSGQLYVNSASGTDGIGWKSTAFNVTTTATWQELTYDFSSYPYGSADSWGQFGMQYYNKSGVLYLDEITFYNSSGDVVYQIDASDISVAPTSLTVSPSSISAITGKSQQLSVTASPSDASTSVIYASDNTSVATNTAAGIVTTVGAGTANINITSSIDNSITATTDVTVIDPDVTNTLVYANFENGLGNYDEVWKSWNTSTNASGPAPAVAVVDNPNTTGNASSKVLKISDYYQYGAVAFKAFDMNKINTIKFKVYSDVEISDLKFELGLNGGISSTTNTTTYDLPAATWTEYLYSVSYLQSANKQFYIKLSSPGSAEATGAAYTIYIDSLIYIAGDGSAFVPVSGIDITTTSISTDDETLQLAANITPANATLNTVTWSLVNASSSIGDTAIFDASAGTLKAVRNGTVTVKAVSADGGFVSEKEITITGQKVPVDSIKLKPSASFPASIATNNGSLRIDTIAYIYPADATDNKINWSLKDDNINQISSTGELTAHKDGEVWVLAVSNSNALARDSILVTITNQVPVSSITVLGEGGATTIETNGGTLQMSAAILPSNAAYQDVEWSVEAGSATATISSTGLLKPAATNGTVVVKATALDGSGVSGTLEIMISGQVAVSSVTVTGNGGATTISDNSAKTLQMYAEVLPAEVSDKSVVWSISSENDADTATISSDGILTAIRNGKVTVRGTSVDAIHYGEIEITISGMIIPVSSVSITNTELAITTDNGTLQLIASILPKDAANQNLVWSISSDDADTASISSTGLLTAIRNGKVSVLVSASDGSGAFDEKEIIISNQILPVESITISAATADITADGGTLQLSATIYPTEANNKNVVWSVDNSTIATINADGLLTAIADGSVIATATAADGSGIMGTYTVTISGQITGIINIESNELSIYPNPVTDELYIENMSSVSAVFIFELGGKMIKSISNTYESKMSINTSYFANGMYVVCFRTKDGSVIRKKFIKE